MSSWKSFGLGGPTSGARAGSRFGAVFTNSFEPSEENDRLPPLNTHPGRNAGELCANTSSAGATAAGLAATSSGTSEARPPVGPTGILLTGEVTALAFRSQTNARYLAGPRGG